MTWAGTKISLAKFMAGATGLEPATFGVTGRVLSNDSSGCSDFFHAGTGAFPREVGTPHNWHSGPSGQCDLGVKTVPYLNGLIPAASPPGKGHLP